MRLATLRALLVSSLLAVTLAPAAAGAAQGPVCVPFAFTQTYRGWGPADRYGQTVTVVYAGTRCTTGGAGAAAVDITGTATTSKGEAFPFQATASWTGAPSGWPPPWWACSVQEAEILWTIPGVYSFAVSATGGVWSLDVQTWGAKGRTTTWTYRAC